MQLVVVGVRRSMGLALVAMVAVVAFRAAHHAPRPAIDPWAPRPAVRVTSLHGSISETVDEITAGARRKLGRVFGLRGLRER